MRRTAAVSAFCAFVCALPFVASPARAQATGQVAGRVSNGETPLRGVTVAVLHGTDVIKTTLTDDQGAFTFDGIQAGTWSLAFTMGTNIEYTDGVVVRAGETTTVNRQVPWEKGFDTLVTVYAASRRLERIVDAPGAVTPVTSQDIQLGAASGQVPRLLEFSPGTSVTQSGLYDYNFNVRGFNTQLNRRIQVVVDGRDPSITLLSNQEWSSFSLMEDDLASAELLRGPSAALYGANSFNGVLSLRTLAPRDSPGGQAKFTFGELGMARANGRWAGALGNGWFVKVLGGFERSRDFARSRNQTVEYPGLGLEAIPLPRDTIALGAGSARFDKYFGEDRLLTLEGGVESLAGPVFLTVTGRDQPDAVRTWSRVNLNLPHWNVLFYTNTRQSNDHRSPTSGLSLWLDDRDVSVEVQGNVNLPHRVRLVGGGSYAYQHVDSANGQGVQTLLTMPVGAKIGAVFGQLDWQALPRLRFVVASRVDASTVHDTQLSPKAAAVYDLSEHQSVRLTFNRAFQVANYGELHVNALGPPLDLSSIEAALSPFLGGVPLGFSFVPIIAVGNPDLKVERIRTVEIGYRGLVGTKSVVTADAYWNVMRDFITDALPGVNPSVAPYMAPAALPPDVRAFVESSLAAVPGLSNAPNGDPIVVLSFGNTGRVTSRGVELGAQVAATPHLTLDAGYDFFDFDIVEATPGTDIHPNAPRRQGSLGATYREGPLTAALHYRRVARFDWSSGIFVGPVPAYGVANLDASYQINDGWQVGLNVSNLANEIHYEVFGGDLLRRRALVWLGRSWN
jgi:outer membrane receptor protein involved in Fe transport